MPAELPIAELRETWLKVAGDFGTVEQQIAAAVNFAASCTEVAARFVAVLGPGTVVIVVGTASRGARAQVALC